MGSTSTARRSWRVARGQIDPRCDYCGDVTFEGVEETHPKRATVDDIIPLSKGGRNGASNWALACNLCNAEKADGFLRPKKRGPHAVLLTRAAELAVMKAAERARKRRLESLPFSLYAPIPGVQDEAWR